MKWSTQQERKMPCSAVTLSLATVNIFLAFYDFIWSKIVQEWKLKNENCPSQVISIVSVALLVIAVSTDNWLSYEVKRKNIMVIMWQHLFSSTIDFKVLRSMWVSNFLELHPSPILYFFQSAFLDSLFFSLLMFVHNTNSNSSSDRQ